MRLTAPHSIARVGLGGAALIGGSVIVFGILSGVISGRLGAGAVLVLLVAVLCLARPRFAIPVVVGYAVLLGGLRRAATDLIEPSGAIDPLIAVLPVAAVLLWAGAIREGAARDRTHLGTLVLLLTLVAMAGALNPIQGGGGGGAGAWLRGLLVGAGGFVYFGVPLLWFWVGRGLVDDRVLVSVFRTVGALCAVVGAYGLAQANGWMPSWDRLWVETVEFASLIVRGETKPFGTMASPGEFARLMGIGIVLWVAGGRILSGPVSHRALSWAVLVVLAMAVVLSGVRGAVLLLVVALGAMLAAKWRAHLMSAGVIALAALALLVALANMASDADLGERELIRRQVEGLSEPIGGESSTFDKRSFLFVRSIKDAIRNPVGDGTGITTPAAARFGDGAKTTESDIGDVAVSWGLAGLLLYVGLVVTGSLTAFRLARRRGDWLALAALGVLVVAGLQWINGGLYAVAPLVWIVLGWADRSWQGLRSGPGTMPGEEAARLRSVGSL